MLNVKELFRGVAFESVKEVECVATTRLEVVHLGREGVL
jgi:hypothetical protein